MLFIARNENIHWAQKAKYQKAVSVNRNEANTRLVNQTETATALLGISNKPLSQLNREMFQEMHFRWRKLGEARISSLMADVKKDQHKTGGSWDSS